MMEDNKRDKIVRVSDVVDMPEKKVCPKCGRDKPDDNCPYCITDTRFLAVNSIIDIIADMEVSPDKLREMGWVRKTEIELDGDEMHRILCCEDTEDLVAEWRAYKRGDRSYFEIMKVITKALANKTQDIIK